MITDQAKHLAKKWGLEETIFVFWVGSALAVLIPVTIFLQGSFPWFTVVWLVVPLVIVLRSIDTHRAGFQRIPWRQFLLTTTINLCAILLISALVEPWSHTYRALVNGAISSAIPDTTFAWLVRFKGPPAWGGLLLYSGLVTIFAEELFFRGWLLKTLQRRMNNTWAILIQAVLFTLPQAIVTLLLAPFQGVIYAIIYSFLAIGVIGGWAAACTHSIWPSLVSATIWNLSMVIWVQ